ncbi:hypothetical protein GCM10011594_04700 [Nakamurella endophytica]|uniref:Uncharacterized protein n=1 Tax=Nakamurella endophytica TaxID=1748367 RepID=A0A917SMV4_9ACTN|nr:hypothetical protein GCM10011594_04700 [Nakamurella endophytica]
MNASNHGARERGGPASAADVSSMVSLGPVRSLIVTRGAFRREPRAATKIVAASEPYATWATRPIDLGHQTLSGAAHSWAAPVVAAVALPDTADRAAPRAQAQ